jgi:hypothetical protein
MKLDWVEKEGLDRDDEFKHTLWLVDIESGRVWGGVDYPQKAEFTFEALVYFSDLEQYPQLYNSLESAKSYLEKAVVAILNGSDTTT